MDDPVLEKGALVVEKRDNQADMGQYIAIGMCLGVVFGIIFDNIAMGISFGMLFGIVLHQIISHQDEKNDEDDQ